MPNLNDLSERELEILHLLAEGKSNKEIATYLYISTNTVKVHLRNIFSKLEVTSRTEAVLFVLRQKEAPSSEDMGLTSTESQTNGELTSQTISSATQALPSNGGEDSVSNGGRTKTLRSTILLSLLVLLGIVILISTGAGLARYFQPVLTPSPSTLDAFSSPTDRWQYRKNLPIPTSGLAVVVYEEQIYAIGGENSQVLSDLLRYDPVVDTWETLPSKPTPVTDIQAAVAGGKIYVPGGRLSGGQPTDILEIYNPREGVWSVGASLPTPLSAYALVAFEGDLYLFGGWNGTEYLNLAWRYDPGQDEWQPLSPMPVARGFAGAASTGGKIYVVGGYDGTMFLTHNDIYSPELEETAQSPWKTGAPLPEGRSAMGIANVVDNLYVIGGESPNVEFFTQMKYSPGTDTWEITTNPLAEPWAYMGVVPLSTTLYAVGGRLGNQPTERNLVYQVIFSISIPIAP